MRKLLYKSLKSTGRVHLQLCKPNKDGAFLPRCRTHVYFVQLCTLCNVYLQWCKKLSCCQHTFCMRSMPGRDLPLYNIEVPKVYKRDNPKENVPHIWKVYFRPSILLLCCDQTYEQHLKGHYIALVYPKQGSLPHLLLGSWFMDSD